MDLNALHRHLTAALEIVDAEIDCAEGKAPAAPTTQASAPAPAPAPKPAPAPAKPKAPKPAPAPKITVETVRAELLKVIEKTDGNDAAREILAGFGAKKVSQLTEDQFPNVLAAIAKHLAPAPETDEDDLTA